MMIKRLLISWLIIFSSFLVFSQEKATGYFDDDSTVDTLLYKFFKDSSNGPLYQCEMIRGNGKKNHFYIGVAFESFQISECKKGCIETYQFKEGIEGYEIYCIYKFSRAYDNWILKSKTKFYNNKSRKIFIPKTITGIDGREYKTGKVKKAS